MDATDTTNGWIGLAEAAELLGISLDAMRRRVRRGEYQRRQIRTRHGPAWQVSLGPGAHGEPRVAPTHVPTVEPTLACPARVAGQASASAGGDGRPELMKALEMLERAQSEVVARTETATLWQARAELLATQLGQAQQRILALEAPREPDGLKNAPGSPSDHVTVEMNQTPSAPPKPAPWWRFWPFPR